MKKFSYSSLALILISSASQAFAQSGDIAKVENFLTNIIQLLVILAGSLATVFFVWGGVRYITSSGNPETLEGAKRTILYAAIGLTISLAAFVITNIVTELAQSSFA